MGPFRWLTVARFWTGGKIGAMGVFDTADCRKTFEELKSKVVEFLQEPKGQFYGIEAIFRDPAGNRF